MMAYILAAIIYLPLVLITLFVLSIPVSLIYILVTSL
jgi:hypothetical protein